MLTSGIFFCVPFFLVAFYIWVMVIQVLIALAFEHQGDLMSHALSRYVLLGTQHDTLHIDVSYFPCPWIWHLDPLPLNYCQSLSFQAY